MRRLFAILLLIGAVILMLRGLGIVMYAESEQKQLQEEWNAADSPATVAEERVLPPGLVARMEFKRLQREVFVLDGRDPGNLKRGPVWLRQSVKLGSGGNTVIAGHRDTHFHFLKDVEIGDRFSVDHGIEHSEFRVSKMRIVLPVERELLAPTNRNVITLVTCYPFNTVGRAKKRMIVTAEMVSELLASPDIQ